MSRPSVPPPPASARWLRTGALVATERLRPAVGSSRRRAVCGASRVLTGLGVRVAVRAPSAPWPRAGRDPGLLLVANAVSALDPLVLQTALPGVLVAGHRDRIAGVPVPAVAPVSARVATALRRGTPVVVRPEEQPTGAAALGRFSPALFAAAAETGAPVCPVALRYRGAGDPPATRSTVATLRWLGAAAGVVVEVHLLPALSSAAATAEELATLAEYAVAAVLEAPSPAPATGLAGGARREPARGPATR
ncbi:hypothetical protein [Geodermatophilus sp. CPCC 205761]|uniref:hypothetical protein n=1 Tax=Geodermatophilus sp. CPCC 205761 TaxID=2936597 RepID=UPI003EE90DB1